MKDFPKEVMPMKTTKAIHFYGDSLTAGYGAAPSDGWISILARSHPDVTCYNHGECGAGLSDILNAAETILFYPAPGETLFLMGGTNDIFSGVKRSTLSQCAEEGIRSFLGKIPFCAGIPILPVKSAIAAGWLSQWNFETACEDLLWYGDFLRRLGKEYGFPVIDFQKEFPQDERYYADGTHPNGKGYALFAEIAEKTLPFPPQA